MIPVPREPIIEPGVGTGALTALSAVGPQEKYMYDGNSTWMQPIQTHTAFTIRQRMSMPLVKSQGKYLDDTVTYSMDFSPRDYGDLLSNMYLVTSLPALPSGYSYTPLVGRAVIKKVEFLIDGRAVETLTDDWYIIRDQLFLNADEKLAVYQSVSKGQTESNTVPATTTTQLVIPLEFFFCHRKTDQNKPYFPMCAISKQTVTIRFTFHTQAWITNYTSSQIDIINPQIMTEEIILSSTEREYYIQKIINYKVNRVWSEASQPYTNGVARMNLTANFPVSMIVWFVRNKSYESENPLFYKSRYQYGYSTDYIPASVPVTFFNGVNINFLDIIQKGKIYLNNTNVLSDFPGALYYSYKQALEHKLSVPTKSIYMYCFGDAPRDYNQEGYVDFRKLNAQTTYIDLTFDPVLAPQIQASYTMYLFYYGYTDMTIQGGRATW